MSEQLPEKIPFAIEIGRIIEVLAAQIYPSPFALLRENVQNAFDAILLRQHTGAGFQPRIEIIIEQKCVRVTDNGIGMSREDLLQHFWRAGSSSKNTAAARAAGVVGTFGIGAMANFGIAEELTVTSESLVTGERTRCTALRSTLSVTQECIVFVPERPTGNPGTEVIATMQQGKFVDVAQAKRYIIEFVKFLPIPVILNGEMISEKPIEDAVPALNPTWSSSEPRVTIGGGFTGDVELSGAVNGDVRIDVSAVRYGNQPLYGRMILRQGRGTLQTLRSRFGLATTAVASLYGFGGLADFLFLEPTAGREALTTQSLQLLQQIVTAIDEYVTLRLAGRPESNANSAFVQWAWRHQRFDLCSQLTVRLEPNNSLSLQVLRERSQASPVLMYAGRDQGIIKHASADRPLAVLSLQSPRRDCELSYMRKYCKIDEVTDEPRVLHGKSPNDYSMAEAGVALRVASVLSNDYFLEADVKFGVMSHALPILVNRRTSPIEIFLDPTGTTVRLLLDVYEREYGAFGHMVKDFVRNVIFSHVSDLVPSATRQGAEAFLKTIQRTQEVFEYERSDLENLTEIWKDYLAGRVTMPEVTRRSTTFAARSYQVLDSSATASVRDVAPDVIANDAATRQPGVQDDALRLGPLPPIQRPDIETDRKLLTIRDEEEPLRGFRAFLAITDRIRAERGDFFLQPHRTSVVWGGQKVLFIFQHHSGEFGLYYDIQTPDLIANESGGGARETCTIVMKNRIFIPLPEEIKSGFLPAEGERKRLESRCDILYIDR